MDLVKWVLAVHNNVSQRLGKPTWTLDKLLAHYENEYKSKKCPLLKFFYIIWNCNVIHSVLLSL